MSIITHFKRKTAVLLVAGLMLLGTKTYAQSSNSALSQESMLYITLGLVFVVSILVLLVAIYVLQLLKIFIKKEMLLL